MLDEVETVSSTRSAFAAILKDGSVVTWGDEEDGGYFSSTVAKALIGVDKIYSTSYAFAAVLKDGSDKEKGLELKYPEEEPVLKDGAGKEKGLELKYPDEYKHSESDKMSLLFNQLRLQKYLSAFEEDEYEFSDLTEIPKEELERLIPKIGPRHRLQRWVAEAKPAIQSSGLAKPVLMALRSNLKIEKQIFTDKLRASILLLAKKHEATKMAMGIIEAQRSYVAELRARPKAKATEK